MNRVRKTTVGALHLPAPHGTDPQAHARKVAKGLQSALPRAGVSGDVGRVQVHLTRAEARDPAAIVAAVTRALKGGAQ